ncbi:unnamed protein product [marine sediment metagenome]|uniref:Uncharacterized protein n=1 Tax=marine sediment metagenome TaxID=412755 RepID=X1VD88_9ZZZZ
MWPFRGKKTVAGLSGIDRLELSQGTTISLDEIVDELIDLRRDSASLNSGVNRIERKLNRWLDVLNIREREPTNQFLPGESLPQEMLTHPGNQDKEEIAAGMETDD